MAVGYYDEDRARRVLRERVQDHWMDAYAPVRHLDPVLIVTALALSVVGIFMVYSATKHRLDVAGLPVTTFATRQLINLAVASVAMVVAAVVDYRFARAYAPILYVATIVLLALVLTPLGVEVNGAKRWIVLGGFQLQPSEIAKVAVILVVAAVLNERKGDPGLFGVVATIGISSVPMALIFLEPDLGTLIVFVWLAFVLLLVGGARTATMLGLGGLGLGAIVVAFRLGLLKEYQLARLIAFLNPGDPSAAETTLYNTNQSLIAIGSGQLTGKGFGQGTQTALAYVPENHTDFIFTVVGEEFGFLGAAMLLALFAVLLWRGLRIAMLAKDLFGTLIATGAVAMIALQLFVNVGMTIGIMPVTGIPLPFVSYGGTSLLTGFVLVGLMLNVHMRRF